MEKIIWFVSWHEWDAEHKHGQKMSALVEASTAASAAELCGDGENRIEIADVHRLGTVAMREATKE